MKIEVKKIDATKRHLKCEIPKDRVMYAMDEVYKDIAKVTKIKGFRPGKVPRHILEQHHAELAKEETLKKAIPEAYREAVERESLEPVDLPEINDVVFKDGIISFTAALDVKPEVKIKDYKGIPVKRKSATVTDEEIEKTLALFAQGQGKDAQVTFDDAFAKQLGYPSLDEFKKSLRRQMEIDKEQHNRLDVENQIVEQLLKSSTLTVPPSLIDKQCEHRYAETKKRLMSQGKTEDDIKKKESEMRGELKKSAERDLKVFFILDKVAKLESISVGENENMVNKVLGYLLKEAHWEEV